MSDESDETDSWESLVDLEAVLVLTTISFKPLSRERLMFRFSLLILTELLQTFDKFLKRIAFAFEGPALEGRCGSA